MTVDIIVVGARVSMSVYSSGKGTVGWDVPSQSGSAYINPEPQVLGCVVHVSSAIQPNTFQIERHIDFVASVSVIAVDPQLVVGGVHPFHPHFVDKHESG